MKVHMKPALDLEIRYQSRDSYEDRRDLWEALNKNLTARGLYVAIVAVGGDTLKLRVTRPGRDQRDAFQSLSLVSRLDIRDVVSWIRRTARARKAASDDDK